MAKSFRKELSSEISPVMQALATYISQALKKPLPNSVVDKTKHHVLDTVTSMISGSQLEPGRKAISYIRTRGGTQEACVIGSKFLTTVENAAFANGILAHADETDDSHAPSLTHPGCGIIPASLAMAEREKRSGGDLLRAVALGYDIGCRLTLALHPYKFREVGHSTHSFGPMFGAATAAGALSGLDSNQVRYLLSYTAQQASGLSCWMRDTDHIEKGFDFGGMPARNGVAAATMVAHGFTGVQDVFAGERNFFVAYDESHRIGKIPEPRFLIDNLGKVFEIMNTNIKRWSVGSPIQAPLDALFDLINNNGIEAADIERVVVRVAHQMVNTVDNRDMPNICLQHMCAVMLLDGKVSFESAHDKNRMEDSQVLKLRRRVELYGDDELTRAMPSRQGIVELTLKDGRQLRSHIKAVRGTAQNPMSREEVNEKCFHLAAPVIGIDRARRLCEMVFELEKMHDVRSLRPLLQR